MNNTPKRPVNTKVCKPLELYSTIGGMVPPSAFRDAPQKSREFVHSLSVELAKNPANYFRRDDAVVIDVHALDAGGASTPEAYKFIKFIQEGIAEDEYATSFPLTASAPDKNKFVLICVQVLGDIIDRQSLLGWYEQLGRPLTGLMPKEARAYNWDNELVQSGLKMGILLENLVKIRDACVAVKRANATPEELESLHELSLSASGFETAKFEVEGFALSLEAATARNARAVAASLEAGPNGKEVNHPFTRSY